MHGDKKPAPHHKNCRQAERWKGESRGWRESDVRERWDGAVQWHEGDRRVGGVKIEAERFGVLCLSLPLHVNNGRGSSSSLHRQRILPILAYKTTQVLALLRHPCSHLHWIHSEAPVDLCFRERAREEMSWLNDRIRFSAEFTYLY